MSRLHQLTVVGAGVLGSQIAWHSAYRGKTVVVHDSAVEAIDRCRRAHDEYAAIYLAEVGATDSDIAAARERLTYTADLAAAVSVADLVIEAVPEIKEVKLGVYKEMAELLPAHALVVTNTSTFVPSDFAAATGRPEKFCALHFANKIWAANFAEIMAHPGTSRDTLTEVTEFAIEIGMVPIPLRKEHNGYVINAWTLPLTNAAQTMVTNGISSPEDIDRTFMWLSGAPVGPMGLADAVGMGTIYNVLLHWGQEFGDAQMLANADYIKMNFLDRGWLGLQSGKGYYEYPNPAYQRADFLAVPDISQVQHIVSLISP
ncbi:3-hydroxyacyl-CoA dehydrogenase [Mycobacterium colombiense]|uniref:3-hydroxyacyl-CoA dehydrogenase n=1 Tax=Mycobacterium colombiense TaxID=339268 RepID=UPI00200A4BD6|nr:3-hydroxyacyl-CoA dehydrogenase [Mycobacterium colombiense]MCK8642401.1 3-hydroxyacyl-CoA dehydrogenase [Mycobacterium colombiense]